ncbi:MAG: tetratricopeptide repeat protein, partial [Cyanobacteria bacterium]|nr:tetratricopeptide repeat protein [Cyanobacteriota bacterium]
EGEVVGLEQAIGVCAQQLGRTSEAKMYLTRSIEKAERIGHTSMALNAFLELSRCYESEKNYAEAMTVNRRACLLAEKEYGKESYQYGTALNSLGLCYGMIGQPEKARQVFIKSSKMDSSVANWESFGPNAYLGLGSCELNRQQYDAAEDCFDRVRKYLETRQNLDLNQARALENAYWGLGVASEGLGQIDKAVTWQEQAVAVCRKYALVDLETQKKFLSQKKDKAKIWKLKGK